MEEEIPFKDDKQASKLEENTMLEFADRVVNRYIYSSSIPSKDKEDVMMSIVEKFLSKETQIREKFTGKSSYKTYCLAVMNRMCCEIIRKELKHWKSSDEHPSNSCESDTLNISESVIIQDEINLLKKILLMFEHERPKLILFLKILYDFKVAESDLSEYCINHDEYNISQFIQNKRLQILTKSEKYLLLREIVFRCEHKSVSPDALRMWFNGKLDRILNRLNGTFQRSKYDRESFALLLEYMFSEQNAMSISDKVNAG